VVLFADDLSEFLKGFDESLRVLEKAVREKRRAGPGRTETADREGTPERSKKPGSRAEDSPGRPKKRSAGDGPGKKTPRLVVRSRRKKED
jgi:hypothetical protein